ncbi:MAG: bifunctional hydroxymethylpyrimidine kinase/phosphomethylpyrimidine kinase [Deltaproteobacteria bacterium]
MSAAVLCVGGLDPSGGAGLLADAEAVTAAGARPLCAATAITVQTSRGVRRAVPLPAGLVKDQAAALLEDERPAVVKLGMLGDPATARALARLLAESRLPLVVDPVVRSTSGARLFLGDPLAGYRPLLALGPILTPNVAEAALLLGCAEAKDRRGMREQGQGLLALGARAVVLKGGHLGGAKSPDLVLGEGGEERWLEGARLRGAARGTGCRFASALAGRLALGEALSEAAEFAKRWVRRGIPR